MKKKQCTGCCKQLPINMFSRRSSAKDGLQSRCKVCRKKYHDKHYQDNKKQYADRNKKRRQAIVDLITYYKHEEICDNCGFDTWQILHFHHMDCQQKDFVIADAVKILPSLDRLLTEMDKCKLLCPNCHALEHFSENFRKDP